MRAAAILDGVDLPSPRMIVAARALLGMTQQALVAEADIAAGSLKRYETGVAQMRSGTLAAVVAVLRRQGIRFIAGRDGVVMGVLLVDAGPGSDGATQ